MTNVVIIEENPSFGRLLKRELSPANYHVSVAAYTEIAKLSARLSTADLVLVNYACGNGSGWDVYHQIKKKYTDTAVMLYVLEWWSQHTVKWIMKAVFEVLNCAKQDRKNIHLQAKLCKKGG